GSARPALDATRGGGQAPPERDAGEAPVVASVRGARQPRTGRRPLRVGERRSQVPTTGRHLGLPDGHELPWRPGAVLARALPLELISVVVPVRNCAPYIGEQMAALANQTYTGPWEVLVVDNGCTDRSMKVVEGWRDMLPRLEIVDASKRRGLNHARNMGVSAA